MISVAIMAVTAIGRSWSSIWSSIPAMGAHLRNSSDAFVNSSLERSVDMVLSDGAVIYVIMVEAIAA